MKLQSIPLHGLGFIIIIVGMSSSSMASDVHSAITMECKYCGIFNISAWKKEEALDNMCVKCQRRLPIKKDTLDDSYPNNGLKKMYGNKLKTASGKERHKFSGSFAKTTRNRNIPKGKGRRTHFKNKFSSNTLSNRAKSSDKTSNFMFYQGQCFKSGDIVSVIDHVDRKTYYAQCTGFLTNQFGEQLVSYTWLLPTQPIEDNKPFNPSMFYLGPEDGSLHHINSVTFICHAPSDYYKPQSFYRISSLNF